MTISLPTRLFLGALLTTAVLLTGCGKQKVGQAGFLSDYSRLKPSDYVEGALFWQSPNYDLGRYDKFMFDPIVVHFAPSDTGGSVDPDKMKELTAYADAKLSETFSRNFEVVDRKGPGVLRVSVAITDVQLGNTVLNIIPQAKLSGVGLGGASSEAYGVDGATGELMFEIKETRRGNQFALEGAGPLDNAKQVIDHWVERFYRHVEQAHAAG